MGIKKLNGHIFFKLAHNQLAGKSLSHMQTLGYHGKKCL